MDAEGHTPLSGESETRTDRRKRGPRPRAVPLLPEVRFFAPTQVEVRSADDDESQILITGAAIVYGAAYRVVDMFGEFRETIHAGSASDLIDRGVDCRLLLNHGSGDGLPMARTISGTMELVDDPDALRFVARLDPRQGVARDFAIAIERGDLNQMSVGMVVGNDDWRMDGGMETRDIYALSDLLDISGVTYPCSPTTHIEIAKRMAFAMPLESRARLRRMEVELRAGKVLSADSQSKLVTALGALHDLAQAGGVDPSDLGPNADGDGDDGSEGRPSAESDAGVVYPDATGQRKAPATAAERRDLSMSFGDQQSAVYQALQGELGDDDGDEDYCDLWICDIGDGWVVFEAYTQSVGLFKASYTLDADGAVTLGDDLQKVTPSTVWVPVTREDADADAEHRLVAADVEDAPDDDAPSPMKASTLRLVVEAGR